MNSVLIGFMVVGIAFAVGLLLNKLEYGEAVNPDFKEHYKKKLRELKGETDD